MKAAVAAGVVSLSLLAARAQEPPVAFEAATITQNKSGEAVAGMRRSPGGRFEATNIQLAAFISFAYQLQPFELDGGPSWLTSERWDVLAKIAGDPPPPAPGRPDAIMLATRALLADRFKLVLRRQTRDVDVYQLVMARADGRPGPALRRSSVDCLACRRPSTTRRVAGRRRPAPTPPIASPAASVSTAGGFSLGAGRWTTC